MAAAAQPWLCVMLYAHLALSPRTKSCGLPLVSCGRTSTCVKDTRAACAANVFNASLPPSHSVLRLGNFNVWKNANSFSLKTRSAGGRLDKSTNFT